MAEEIGLKVVLEADTSALNGALKGVGGGKSGAGGGLAAAGVAGAAGGAAFAALPAIASMLQKASPALQGTFKILESSFMILFRPLGDFLSMILRPLALLLLKVSISLLKWLSNVLKKTEAEERIEGGGLGAAADILGESGRDLLDGAKTIGEHIKTAGEVLAGLIPETGIEPLDTFINGIVKLTGDLLGFIADLGVAILDAAFEFGEGIGTWIAETMKAVFEWGQEIGSNIAKWLLDSFKALGDFGKWLWLTATTAIGNLVSDVGGFGEWLFETITTAIGSLDAALGGLATWIWDELTSALKSIVNAIIGAANSIIGWLRSINVMGWSPFGWMQNIPTLATGGEITQSGLAYVHAGERVVPAGVNRTNNLGGVTINVRGGDYNEQELARRISDELMLKLGTRVRL